ncbi:uncharacterized protein LOC110447928 isoform X2 [Mizuhopecten yessoensis]|uniref:uncharacterized protein LOC110447928 isoform X2 n=1 Tax=Mizuhopecten yessoensis TaxID=6573 RepID=UPI000B45EE27|nr:uncharacterized protein LOC110447928 isoform X2 [Mizuhopecten yessoensis]
MKKMMEQFKLIYDCKEPEIPHTRKINYSPKIKTKKSENLKETLAALFECVKDIILEGDIQPWPRWSLSALAWSRARDSFIEIDYPEEVAKLAAETRQNSYQENYRKFLYPDVYAKDHFKTLVTNKLQEYNRRQKSQLKLEGQKNDESPITKKKQKIKKNSLWSWCCFC